MRHPRARDGRGRAGVLRGRRTVLVTRPGSRFLIADDHSAGQHGAVTIGPAILSQLPLSEIDAVVFYKRDEMTTDLICCDVEVNGRVWTFHEEADGWQALIVHLSALPAFRHNWHASVLNPPFDASETIAFNRRSRPEAVIFDAFNPPCELPIASNRTILSFSATPIVRPFPLMAALVIVGFSQLADGSWKAESQKACAAALTADPIESADVSTQG